MTGRPVKRVVVEADGGSRGNPGPAAYGAVLRDAASGAVIVSGGAYGIDGAAHRAALGVGGATVALLAGGVDRAYPQGHQQLLRTIAASGAVVSEVPCGTAPTKWRFLSRNRIIAALSDATVVIEAGWRSGSLNTAGHAAALGRPLGAVPGPVTSAASAGCHRLLREYDARCVTTAAEVRELWGDAGSAPEGRIAGDPEQTPIRLVRPLLGWRRAELAALVAESGTEPVDDPANRDVRYDRSRARRLLADTPWLLPDRLAAASTSSVARSLSEPLGLRASSLTQRCTPRSTPQSTSGVPPTANRLRQRASTGKRAA